MIQSGQEKKRGIADRLPKLGRVSQLFLIIGGFLILFIPLWLLHQQQPAKQAELTTTLARLQKMLATEETPKAKLEAELHKLQSEIEAAKASYPSITQAPEIIDSLLALARENDIKVTSTRVSTSRPAKALGPVLTVELGLLGQVPKFQNFLLTLGDTLPTSQINRASFTIAPKEGEYDHATITLEIQCYEGAK